MTHKDKRVLRLTLPPVSLVECAHQIDVRLSVDRPPALVCRHQRLVLRMQVATSAQVLDATTLKVGWGVVLGRDAVEVHPRVLGDVGHVTLVHLEEKKIFNQFEDVQSYTAIV